MTVTGLVAVVFGVVFFGGETKEISKMISAVSFVSLEKKEPVFFTVPVLIGYHRRPDMVWSEFETNHPQQASQLMENLPKSTETLSSFAELWTVAVMQYLGQSYDSNWDVLKTSRVLPGITSTKGQGLNTNPKDKKCFNSTELLGIFEESIFKDSLSQIHQLTLPKRTVIKYITPSGNLQMHQIVISKKFSFRATINLYFSTYVAGLGKVANYTGITEPSNIWNVNWEELNKFGTVAITVDCNAKFFSLKSGNPEVQLYRKWIENMFDNLYEEFDWSNCNDAMKGHFEELAHQNIVTELGKGFEQKKTMGGSH